MPMTRMMMPILFSQFVPSVCSSCEPISRAETGTGFGGGESGGGESGGGTTREGVDGGATGVGVVPAAGFSGVGGGGAGGGSGLAGGGILTETAGSGGETVGAFGISGHGGILIGPGVTVGFSAATTGAAGAAVSGVEITEASARRRSSS
jgi:hypothetical protein